MSLLHREGESTIRRLHDTAIAFGIAVGMAVVGIGCLDRGAERPACEPEQAQACRCDDGTPGSRLCRPDRTWGRCRCAVADVGDEMGEDEMDSGTNGDVTRVDSREQIDTSGPVDVDAGAGQRPYEGMLHAIPGQIEAEDFDHGGEGVAYHDTTPENLGNSPYRADTAVDLSRMSGGGHNVGYVEEGEWLEYTVDVTDAADYLVEFIVATPNDGAEFRISVGAPSGVSTRVDVPNTKGWSNWQPVEIGPLSLGEGRQVLRIDIGAVQFDLDRFAIEKTGE